MPRDAARQVVGFLHDRAGEYLRGVVHYFADDYEVLYLRDDVDALYPGETLEEVIAYWRCKKDQQGDTPFALGNRHCTTHIYDEAILFHFTQSEDVGTVITLDPEAGCNLIQFITACLEELYYHSPQDIEQAPTWLREP